MPEFKRGGIAHASGGTHEHCCYLGRDHQQDEGAQPCRSTKEYDRVRR